MDEHTPRGYPLPHPEHLLSDDVIILREALTQIDVDLSASQARSQALEHQVRQDLHRLKTRLLLNL